MDTDTRTEAESVAGIIRSAAAWWQLAADALDADDLERAAKFAALGHVGTFDMRERTERLEALAN